MAPNIRFIIDSSHGSAFNMAADQFLLRNCIHGDTIFIRFYSWKVPSITLGCMQKPFEVLNAEKMGAQVEWIKRPTGGRAVLHFEDLTYSCIFPKTLKFMGSSVRESYNLITRCLLKGLGYAGILCEAHDSYDQLLAVKREVKLPCFLAPNRDEIMVKGRKLVGSAQRRGPDSILQHGSMPLTDYYRRLPEFLNLSVSEQEAQRSLLAQKSICVHEITPNFDTETIVQSLIKGFVEILKLDYSEKKFSPDELERIETESQSDQFLKKWHTGIA
ncbi:MAG: hypothetical protein Q4F84_04020 [Fibrobacter sp.]|nr:hypothetical protein [Fibrobacter sp.]